MTQQTIYIITHSDAGEAKGLELIAAGFKAEVHRSPEDIKALWNTGDLLVFIGALGICVRFIAPLLVDKKNDPAVLNMDANGHFVQSVVSGHIGGGNDYCKEVARLLGAQPVITTVSDTSELWPLDTLPKRFDWTLELSGDLTSFMANFVNGVPTALLLEARDKGTLYLENNLPSHLKVFYHAEDMAAFDYKQVIAVTPMVHKFDVPTLYYRPAMLCLGLGCQRDLSPELFVDQLNAAIVESGFSPLSLAHIGSVDLKADERALLAFAAAHNHILECFTGKELSLQDVPNPSDKVEMVTQSAGVSEAAAMQMSQNTLCLEKTKGKAGDKHFTFALAISHNYERKGFVEIVGAGPGDPELVSVKGKRYLQSADLILYAGSLVPKELTYYAKPGCVVVSSAGMALETQVSTMQEFYDKGLFVVRLHTGDPCIYGAIQEQMAKMDELGMRYHITPGISSFQAAAAALESQFTIPEEVQSIILTRGEGRTPMPDREQLHKLAKSQSTMCIYLSASIADKVQSELMVHYPEDTPVAVCYKLTWKDEKIWRTTLGQLAQTISDNNLKMTTMIVVGKAIGNRSGESKLYHKNFTHAFREGIK